MKKGLPLPHPAQATTVSSEWARYFATALLLWGFVVPSWSDSIISLEDSGYRLPPKAIIDLIDVPPRPNVRVSPDGRWLALEDQRQRARVRDVTADTLRLAGISVDPKTGNPPVDLESTRVVKNRNFSLIRVSDGRQRDIRKTPTESMSGVLWAPDGLHLAFLHFTENGPELWAASVEKLAAWPLVGASINEAAPPIRIKVVGGFGACEWMSDSRRLLCLTVPTGRGSPPKPVDSRAGPSIEDTRHEAAGTSFFGTDLLRNSQDDALFQYYATSQPQIIDVLTGERTNIGVPAVYFNLRPSPNGQYLLCERLLRPYSRRLPYWQFARTIDILDASGGTVRQMASLPEPFQAPGNEFSMNAGPRDFDWRPDRPATVYFEDVLDGELGHAAPYRDRLLQIAYPFDALPREVLRTQGFIGSFAGGSVGWTERGQALVKERDVALNSERMWLVDREEKEQPALLWERHTRPLYGELTSEAFVFRTNPQGQQILLQTGHYLYLQGTENKDPNDGPRMFIDRLDLSTHRRQRIFRGRGESYESFEAILDKDANQLLTTFETPTQPPNYLLRNLRTGSQRYLTSFDRYFRSLPERGVELSYSRPDGLPLSGILFLPMPYENGRPVPTVLWSYPHVVESIDAARTLPARSSANAIASISPYAFSGFGSDSSSSDELIRALVTQGYAIFYADMPLVGGRRAYETYVDQIVANARAAVDVLVAHGITRPGMIGIGGHSMGGTVAAGLLAHTDLFAAGVSVDGQYDPARTPFGLAMDTRTYWQVPFIYRQISNWESADHVNFPLLLIHGLADSNPLTPPESARFLYASLRGLRKTARLVLLPGEDHDPRGLESVLQMTAEMVSWFNQYLKHDQSTT
jgi:dipeptidyl aminopeptidase/acylaminoacyl peptidase